MTKWDNIFELANDKEEINNNQIDKKFNKEKQFFQDVALATITQVGEGQVDEIWEEVKEIHKSKKIYLQFKKKHGESASRINKKKVRKHTLANRRKKAAHKHFSGHQFEKYLVAELMSSEESDISGGEEMEESKKIFFIKSPSWRSEAFHEFILQVEEKITQDRTEVGAKLVVERRRTDDSTRLPPTDHSFPSSLFK